MSSLINCLHLNKFENLIAVVSDMIRMFLVLVCLEKTEFPGRKPIIKAAVLQRPEHMFKCVHYEQSWLQWNYLQHVKLTTCINLYDTINIHINIGPSSAHIVGPDLPLTPLYIRSNSMEVNGNAQTCKNDIKQLGPPIYLDGI